MEAPNLCQELQEEGETEVQLSRQMATLALLARGGHGSPEGSKPDQALIFHSPVMFFSDFDEKSQAKTWICS